MVLTDTALLHLPYLTNNGSDYKIGDFAGKGPLMRSHLKTDIRKQKLPAFILTIDENGGPRRKNALYQFNLVGIDAEFVLGDTAQSPIVDHLYSSWMNLLFSKRSVSSAEIAAYAGHRKIWQQIVDRDIETALIVEDDFCIKDADYFLQCIDVSLSNRQRWDIVKFFDYLPKKIISQKTISDVNFVDYKYPASGLVCYLITKASAVKLLNRRRIYRPVDEDISHMWEFGIYVCSISPNPVIEIGKNLGGSLIEQGRLDTKRRRNIYRSLWGNILAIMKNVAGRRYNRR